VDLALHVNVADRDHVAQDADVELGKEDLRERPTATRAVVSRALARSNM